MGVRLSLFLEAYGKTWNMCLALLLFFVVVAVAARWFKAGKLDFHLPPRLVFWACVVPGFVLMAVCLTLIDKPYFSISNVAKEWLFMFSAFLGVPVSIPLLAGAVWATAHHLLGIPVKASSLALLLLGMFALGCAASNIHDVVWCGTITGGYTQHHAAGYDLDYFVDFGNRFGIARATLADYATLRPCAVVLVLGELLVAVACFV
ncbi:MAG: hypothetical protein NTU83_10765, partial [Candidatus Hydrogenedentes bacterium]|nr:hypothetical protein [Candidatus Hydrogenedentota bacterium]